MFSKPTSGRDKSIDLTELYAQSNNSESMNMTDIASDWENKFWWVSNTDTHIFNGYPTTVSNNMDENDPADSGTTL